MSNFDEIMKMQRPSIGPDREYVGLDPAIIQEAAALDHKKSIPRDTQFAGFAKLLWEEMQDHAFTNEFEDRRRVGPEYVGYMQKLITQRAYDLACHILSEVSGFSNPEAVLGSPTIDITEWAKEK